MEFTSSREQSMSEYDDNISSSHGSYDWSDNNSSSSSSSSDSDDSSSGSD